MKNIKIWNKEGVFGDLCPELQKELGRIIRYHKEDGCQNFYITSKREGNHIPGSFHNIGRAVDFLTDISFERLRAYVGLEYDLIKESDHIHLEYDPKIK